MSTTQHEAKLSREVTRLNQVLKDIHAVAVIWAEQVKGAKEKVEPMVIEKKVRHIGMMALRGLSDPQKGV